MAKKKSKFVKVPLRLHDIELRTIEKLAALIGYPLSTVASVLVGVGFLQTMQTFNIRQIEEGLKAMRVIRRKKARPRARA